MKCLRTRIHTEHMNETKPKLHHVISWMRGGQTRSGTDPFSRMTYHLSFTPEGISAQSEWGGPTYHFVNLEELGRALAVPANVLQLLTDL